MTCPLCVQWRCSLCKSQDWPQCCDDGWLFSAEPIWPDGTIAEITQDQPCDPCTELLREYEEDHQGDPT